MAPHRDLRRRMLPISILAARCAVLLILGGIDAHAESGQYAERGVYLALAGSGAFPLFSDAVPASIGGDPTSGLGGGSEYGNTVGFNAAAGLRVTRYLGFDLGIEYIPSFESGALARPDIDTTLITINGRFYLPGVGIGLSDRIQPYALTGAGVMIADTDITRLQSDFAARLGGGLDYWLTDALALGVNATYVLTTGDVDGLDYVSLSWGFQYTFH